MPSTHKGKILFLITEDWFFCLHRLPLARMLRDQGWEIMVATREVAHGNIIRQEGFTLLPVNWVRHSLNPLRGLMEISKILSIYRQQQPDLIHHIAIKPCVYGGIASLFHKRHPSLIIWRVLGSLSHAQDSLQTYCGKAWGWPSNIYLTALNHKPLLKTRTIRRY